MQKKVLSLATLTLLLFSILSSLHLNSICPVRAAPENIRVYIDPTTLQDVSLGPGDQFSIDIRTDYVENLWAYQFWLSFNPEVLQGVSVENGPFLDSAGGEVVVIPGPGFDNEVGELKLFGACIFFVGPPPADSQLADGGGILARVTFEVASYGSSPISLGAPETALSNKTGGYELRNNQTGEWEYCYGQRRSNVPPFYPMEPYLPWIESLGHGYFSNEGAYPTPPSFVQDNKLVFESSATYQWLDPHVSYYQYDYWTLWHSVEMLLWYERDNATKIIPWLAEDYTVSGDGKSYNFTLRQGITFQDGTPFNATAVWFSLNRLLIIDGTSGDGINHGTQAAWIVQQLLNASLSSAFWWGQAYDAAWVQAVLDQNFVEILDDYTVRLNLFTPTTQFLPIMAGPWAAIISPTSTIKVDYEHGGWGTWDGNYITYFEHMAGNGDTGLNLPENGWKVGTGAYYVESVSPTTYKIELKAYDDYWGGPNDMNLPPAGKDRIETIEYIYQPSFATRLLDLKAGTATGIQVPTANMFQVIDRDKWIDEGILESIVEGATTHGVFPQLFTWWLCFNTNVTNPDGTLKSWQPFADWRIRMAAASAVNMTYMNIHVNNRSAVVANNIIPPGTVPEGSYNPNVKPAFSFDLTRARELLLDARDDPMNPTYYSNTYYNGTPIPAGVVDNSFGPDFAHAKPVEFYVQTGATAFQEILTTISDNLNAICMEEDLGIRFYVVIVPGGQQYMLASMHLIDSYVGGWICDYNHVLNWLAPMYRSTGTYFSWNLWNITRLDALYDEAVTADQAGDTTTLLEINDEMNTIANQMLTYMVWWHPGAFYTRSTWLKGWYVNMAYGVDLGSSMYYEIPVEVVEATIDIAPDLLNLKSKGKRITYYIELPEGYDVGDVNVSTILLNDTIPVGPEAPTQIGDYDSDDVPDLMVKFSRAMVLELILSERITNGYVTLTITGEVDGTPFRGEDTIRVLMTGGGTRGHK